ncbi:MAG: hypothetical protein JST54_12610 [Deltaproteobacteria bacterium]|nr:hypothetical protein [Deltaproteobacteria bacterium]
MKKRIDFIVERKGCTKPKARELLLKASVLYLRDDWPGKMTKLPPWDFRALFKLEKLGDYVDRADKQAWNEVHPDDWEPAA